MLWNAMSTNLADVLPKAFDASILTQRERLVKAHRATPESRSKAGLRQHRDENAKSCAVAGRRPRLGRAECTDQKIKSGRARARPLFESLA
jgi:hypothetical protein